MGKSHFSRFFPGVKSLFLIFPGVILAFFLWKFPFSKSFTSFLKVKSKKKKSPRLFSVIFLLTFRFPHFPQHFPFYPFSLPHFSPISHQKFPNGKSLGWHSAPPPTPPVTRLLPSWVGRSGLFFIIIIFFISGAKITLKTLNFL